MNENELNKKLRNPLMETNNEDMNHKKQILFVFQRNLQAPLSLND